MKMTCTRFCTFVLAILICLTELARAQSDVLFTDNFEGNLDRWEVIRQGDVAIRDSNDPSHNRVLVLIPNGDVYALIKGSDRWSGVRIEGDVLFPKNEDNYLGVIYNFQKNDARVDFGNIYIKGNGSYLQVNPHRDFNVGRTLYPEYHITLDGGSAIHIGEWQHFKVEIIQSECHFFVGDMESPQLTFSLSDLKSGLIGFQPRSVGGEVWIDNVVIHSIREFSYKGEARPSIHYETAELLTKWESIGPLDQSDDDIARNPDGRGHRWRPFPADPRGAVITGMIIDYHGPHNVGYFRASFHQDTAGELFLHLSTVDDLALWVNGRFQWFISRGEYAWFDFGKNQNHAGQRVPIPVRKGENQIIVRARGGVYASGGFFARIEQ